MRAPGFWIRAQVVWLVNREVNRAYRTGDFERLTKLWEPLGIPADVDSREGAPSTNMGLRWGTLRLCYQIVRGEPIQRRLARRLRASTRVKSGGAA